MTPGEIVSRRRVSPAAVALLAGLLYPLAFAPWQWYPLGWLALIPLFLATEAESLRVRVRRGLAFGLGAFGMGLYWLLPTIHEFGHMPWLLAVPTWALLVLYCAAYPAVFAAVGRRLAGELPFPVRVIVLYPLIWVLLEGGRGWAFTGFPWLSLGAAQEAGPLGGYMPLAGALGAGLVAAVINGMLLVAGGAVNKRRWRPAAASLVGALLVLAGGWGAGSLEWSRSAGPALDAALVQGAVPQRLKWDADARERILDRYRRLTRAHLDADVVIWPETATPVLAAQAQRRLGDLIEAARARDTALLVGAPERQWQDGTAYYHNSAFLWGAGDGGYYRKRHLVPFGEYVPLRSILFFAERFVPGGGAFRPGTSAAPLTLPGGAQAGVSICYEDAFAGETATPVAEGAGLLVNLTNDAWFGDSIGPAQHAQLAQVRARELARPLLRVANTGTTFAVDPGGTVASRLLRNEPGVARVRVQPRAGRTPFAYLGPGGVLGLAGLAWAALVLAGRGRKRGAANGQ